MSLTTVNLHGHLQAFGNHDFDVSTIGEVLLALQANFPTFRAELIKQRDYVVLLNGKAITEPELQRKAVDGMVIDIVPIIEGNAFLVPIAVAMAEAALVAIEAALPSILINLALTLVFTGISALLTDRPKTSNAKVSNNTGFSSVTDSITQGQVVPIAFGMPILCDTVQIGLRIDVVQRSA